ncbi:DcmR-like sensory protein [Prauserella shujinwangii]|uniref:DcmR-like sensory protein n=1 Tax=Prauserella shujinwangii TaxID=1453103 RepID=A0A2T0LPN1_9PSEU|nr:DcmR-like sensory protein [Prauserella shujinwangii]
MDGVRRLSLHDHVCWVYEDIADVRKRIVDFLADGLALGQRVCYVTESAAPPGELPRLLDGLGGVDDALREGALQIQSLAHRYTGFTGVGPADQVAAYAAATREALAAGYTGFRVAAEATGLVREPEQRASFARYEHLVDRYMTREPFAALCAYDRRVLGPEATAQIACMHPMSSPDAAPFRLHAVRDAAFAVDGELDRAGQALFAGALAGADPEPAGGELLVDATGLHFIDHRSLLQLAELAERRRATLTLRTALRSVPRLIDILGLTSIRAELTS